MTAKSTLQQLVDEQCETIERVQRERDSVLRERAEIIAARNEAERERDAYKRDLERLTATMTDVTVKPPQNDYVRDGEFHHIRIERDEDGKWVSSVDSQRVSRRDGVVTVEPIIETPAETQEIREPFDAVARLLNDFEPMPHVAQTVPNGQPLYARTPEPSDYILAGVLSTIWPLTLRHPANALHLAIYINDHYTEL